MSNASIGIRLPVNLHRRLEDYIAKTHATKTEVILNALAQYLSASEELSLCQRVGALEAQILEIKVLVNNSLRTVD